MFTAKQICKLKSFNRVIINSGLESSQLFSSSEKVFDSTELSQIRNASYIHWCLAFYLN